MTPLFLGEVVRTYSWMIVLGNNGFLNTLLLKLGLVERPLRMMFTSGGVIAALAAALLDGAVRQSEPFAVQLAAAKPAVVDGGQGSHLDFKFERLDQVD